jgi:hypothetical protein
MISRLFNIQFQAIGLLIMCFAFSACQDTAPMRSTISPDSGISSTPTCAEGEIQTTAEDGTVTCTAAPVTRPEMRGPQNTDIDNILAGLKTRTVDIHAQPQTQGVSLENDSMISISSLRETQNVSMPKRTQRKQRSDKNIVSLDI